MSVITPPAISALPTPPSTSSPADFDSRADAWAGALTAHVTQTNAASANVYANALDAEASALAADADATAASGALAAMGAVAWVSGTTYAIGNARYSPADLQTYRRKTAGAGTTDPSTDPTNWALVSNVPPMTGASGKFLTNNGTAASWATVPPAALVLLATLTPTAAANIDFLSVFSSAYDNYLVIGDGIKFATDDGIGLRLAVAGVADAGSNYVSTVSTGLESSTPTSTPAISGGGVRAAGRGANFRFEVLNVNDTTRTKSVLSRCSWNSTVAGPGYTAQETALSYFPASVVTGFRLYSLFGGTFTAAGKIRVYGYTNT